MVGLLWVSLGFGVVCTVFGLVLWGLSYHLLKKDRPQVTRREIQSPGVAILIPARDESNVVSGILSCLKKQTFPVDMSDVYVVVESLADPTVEICQKRGVNFYVREKVTAARARKGFALDEVIKDILRQQKHYDVYFIFDADNLINEQFIERMVLAYQAGYDITTSYRNALNANASVVATSAALTFSMLNTVENRQRIKTGGNVVFSGTGCFVDGGLVEKWGGWPFRSLTEDYEMSLYAIQHQLNTTYFEEAEFFDEQPTTFVQSFVQRVRWIRGYFDARKIYIPRLRKRLHHEAKNRGSIIRELIGMWPFILLAVGIIVSFVAVIILGVLDFGVPIGMMIACAILIVVYIIMVLVTIWLLGMEKYQLTFGQKLKAAFYNPFYLASYVPCALVAVCKRKITWQKIEHGTK